MLKKASHFLGLFCLFVCLNSYGQATVKVLVYPGTELVQVVQLLTDTIPTAQSTYNQEVLTYFQQYKNHPAVQQARVLRRRHQLSCDFPVRLSWALYNFPDVKLATMTDMGGYEKVFDMQQTQAFLQLCVRFYYDTHFWQFFQAHSAEYAAWVTDFNRGLYQDGQLGKLNDFYRVKRGKEVIITLGALNCGTYAVPDMRGINPVQANKSIIMVAYTQVVQGLGDRTKRPDFHAPASTSQLVWHELGHAYLASTFQEHRAEINNLAYIIQQDSVMRSKAAMRGGWANYLNENTTQAVTSLLKIRTGLVKREEELEKSPGEFYLLSAEMLGIIEREYYGSKRYRNFDEFFPRMLAEIKKNHPMLPSH